MVSKSVLRLSGELHIGHRLRQKYVLSTLRKLSLSDKRILDAGCGSGDYSLKLAEHFPTASIDAIDISIKDTAFKKSLQNLKFFQEDLTDFVSPSTYDLIYTVDVLEHIEEDSKVLSNFYASLKPNGLLLVHVPLIPQNFIPHRFLIHRFSITSADDHVREGYTTKELIEKLQIAGFHIQKTVNTFGWFGSLGWSLMKLLETSRLRYRLLLHPLNLLLMEIDYWLPKRRGEGILVLAQK